MKLIAKNKKAYFNYEILDKMEAGIVLVGTEVKSIRAGHVVIKDGFTRIDKEELWLANCYIRPYDKEHTILSVDPERSRKLLLHKQQIRRLIGKLQEKSLVLVPLAIYLKDNKVKVELGLGKSKKKFDKRQSIKDRDVKRDMQRALRHH